MMKLKTHNTTNFMQRVGVARKEEEICTKELDNYQKSYLVT